MHNKSRVSIGVATALVVLWALIPGAASAAPRQTIFIGVMGSSCIDGLATLGATVKFEWHSANGTLRLAETEVADSYDGRWEACINTGKLRTGDVLSAKVAKVTHTLKVPTLTLKLDRVTDTVWGKAPAGSTVHLDHPYVADLVANSSGKFSYSTSTNFYGGVIGSYYWYSPVSDQIQVSTMVAQVIVWIGSPRFDGWARSRQKVTATLSTVSAALTETTRATGKTTALFGGDFEGYFRDASGHKTNIVAGDHLSAMSVASDADWIVPQIDGTADVDSNVVTGHCSDNGTRLGYYYVGDVRPGWSGAGSGAAWGILDANGDFTVDFDDPASGTGVYSSRPSDVLPGDELHIWCEQTTGDYAVRVFPIN